MINLRPIPEGSIEIQTGLWLHKYEKTYGETTYVFSRLYSSEGYCFYDVTDEVYEDGSRPYYQYMSLAISQSNWTTEQLNATYISIPIEPGFEIVGGSGKPEIV